MYFWKSTQGFSVRYMHMGEQPSQTGLPPLEHQRDTAGQRQVQQKEIKTQYPDSLRVIITYFFKKYKLNAWPFNLASFLA